MRGILILICLCVSFASAGLAQERTQAHTRLTLKGALQSVDAVNFQVMMANARFEHAIARIAQAQSGLLLDSSSFKRFQAAKNGGSLSKAELEKTREDILALVAALFVDAQRKQQTARLLKTLLAKDRMAYEFGQTNLTQRTGTELDSSKHKTDLEQTRYLYQQATLQAEDARLDLAAALQLPIDGLLVFVDDKDFLKTLEKSAAVNFNNATNADMILASSVPDARKSDLRKAKAQKRLTAQRSLLIALHAQEIGSANAFNVMQAKADLAIAEDGYNEAQAAWMMAHIDLLHAQGRLRQLVKKGE